MNPKSTFEMTSPYFNVQTGTNKPLNVNGKAKLIALY